MSTEIFTKSTRFPGGINPGQLLDEIIANVTITTAPILISTDDGMDQVKIIFVAPLSAPEFTELDTVVIPNHVPVTNPNNELIDVTGTIRFESRLADPRSIQIDASDPAGGIDVNCGTGGFTLDSGNTVSIDAGAASNFTTSVGNIDIDAAGVLNLQGGGGANIGTTASNQVANIGNTTGTTRINMQGGTAGIHLDTTGPLSLDAAAGASNFTLGTTADAQDLTLSITGATDSSIVLSSAGTGADAIKLAFSSS